LESCRITSCSSSSESSITRTPCFCRTGKSNRHANSALLQISPGHVRRNVLPVGDDKIDNAPLNVALYRAEMLGKRVAGGFAGLRQSSSQCTTRGRFRAPDRVRNFRYQQVRQNARVERTGTDQKSDPRGGIASIASGTGRTRRGFKSMRRMATLLAEMLVSPWTRLPFSSTASSVDVRGLSMEKFVRESPALCWIPAPLP